MEIATLPEDRVLLLGPLQVIQNRAQLPLPPSRKVRALLAYLAMAPRPPRRGIPGLKLPHTKRKSGTGG
jgi:hypothetical protein